MALQAEQHELNGPTSTTYACLQCCMVVPLNCTAAIVDLSSCGVQVLDFLLVMDIVLQFFRAYVNKKSVLVVQLARIRRNYLGTKPHCLCPESAQGCPLSNALSCPLSMTSMGSLACATWARGNMPTASLVLCADLDLLQHIHCICFLHALHDVTCCQK